MLATDILIADCSVWFDLHLLNTVWLVDKCGPVHTLGLKCVSESHEKV